VTENRASRTLAKQEVDMTKLDHSAWPEHIRKHIRDTTPEYPDMDMAFIDVIAKALEARYPGLQIKISTDRAR
jgi:hypothetical protein